MFFSSLNSIIIHRVETRNHDRDGVWMSDPNLQRIFTILYFCFFRSTLLVSIEKIHQTLKTVFDHISKHLKVRQKYSAARRKVNSLLGVWKCSQTWSFVFDILHHHSQLGEQNNSHETPL